MHTRLFTCFGAAQGGGNPALVVEDGPPDPAQRLLLARERALTCVFIDAAAASAASGAAPTAATLDFVYPHMRSPLCLHATLAAASVLFARQGGDAPLSVTTAMRGQRIGLSREGETVFASLARQQASQVAADEALARRLLAAPALRLAGAPRIASVGSPKLLLEVADLDTLYALAPDLQAIAAWGREHGISGCYAWCRTGAGAAEGRNFNHLDPALEDSATGVAAGALTLALGHGLILRQGRAVGRDCLIRTAVEGESVLVGGWVQPC